MEQKASANSVGIWLTGILLIVIASNACTSRSQRAGLDWSMDRQDVVQKSEKQETVGVKAEIQIKIEDFVFEPAEITVEPGTRITWINKDDAPHTATSTEEKFNSGGLDTDDKFSFVFSDRGDFPYYCALHPHMKAVIKVR
jgi:plastocyanin